MAANGTNQPTAQLEILNRRFTGSLNSRIAATRGEQDSQQYAGRLRAHVGAVARIHDSQCADALAVIVMVHTVVLDRWTNNISSRPSFGVLCTDMAAG
jgi:hypothetical protein